MTLTPQVDMEELKR
jgi:hypothetical protein